MTRSTNIGSDRGITAMPSPLNTNRERLYIFRSSRPLGALDGKLKRLGDAGAPDLSELRTILDELLSEHLGEGEALEAARAALHEHLGSGEQYDREADRGASDEDDKDEEAENVARRRMKDRGCSDEDIDEILSMLNGMPRNGGGGRLDREARDRKRGGAHDRLQRRQMAADAAEDRAADSFFRMYPEAARLKNAF